MYKSEVRYFNFPVCLLKEFLNRNYETLRKIFCYSIYCFVLKQGKSNDKYAIKEAFNYYKAKYTAELVLYNEGKELYNSISSLQKEQKEQKNEAMTGIETSIFFDYKNNEKTEFEKVVLLAYLSIKSILGTKTYCKTNKELLFSRMSGSTKTTSSINNELVKYLTRYNFEKIITELSYDWNLKYYSYYTKGFYVSFKLTSAELITKGEANRQSNRIKFLKSEKAEIRKKYCSTLNKKVYKTAAP